MNPIASIVTVASVNASPVRTFEVGERKVRSGILKQPVAGRVWLRELGLDGDAQADHRFHGGRDKAVYLDSLAHYTFWSDRLKLPLPPGTFGENLTIDGPAPLEELWHVGDTLALGDARIELTLPRQPCWKLEARMGIEGFVHAFMGSGRLGIYARVHSEGQVGAGDRAEVVARLPDAPTVAELIRGLYFRDDEARAKIVACAALPEKLRRRVERRSEGIASSPESEPDLGY